MKSLILIMFFFTSLLLSQELRITADQFKTDEKTGITIFNGNVKVFKGSDKIEASSISIYTNEKREPIKFIADGDVSFYIKTDNNSIYKGVAQKVVYLPIKKEYHFFRDVHLEQIDDKKVIIGDEVFLKTIEGKAYAKGALKEPVIMIFDMPEKGENKSISP